MKDKIQKLIKEIEARKKSHSDKAHKSYLDDDIRVYNILLGRSYECDFFIYELMLLLNEQPEAITEDAHFRKHDVDGRAECESDKPTGSTCASSSETAAVDGHEQTKELCRRCKRPFGIHQDDMCYSCWWDTYAR